MGFGVHLSAVKIAMYESNTSKGYLVKSHTILDSGAAIFSTGWTHRFIRPRQRVLFERFEMWTLKMEGMNISVSLEQNKKLEQKAWPPGTVCHKLLAFTGRKIAIFTPRPPKASCAAQRTLVVLKSCLHSQDKKWNYWCVSKLAYYCCSADI